MSAARWDQYPNFSKAEFDCKHCGANEMQHEFMVELQNLRALYGRPMVVSSGYRCPQHPVEARKQAPGTHSEGCAVDIACNGQQAYQIMKLAFDTGKFTGVGVAQRAGVARFVHLDTSTGGARPNSWSY